MRRFPTRWPGFLPRTLRSTLPALLLALLLPALALAQANGKLQLHHMMIGQGDATLLISPNGQTALFDDGVYTNCTYIKSYLQGLGLTTIDYHFTSHYHADHIGCLDDLAAIGITVGTAGYDRGYSYSSATYTSYVNTLGNKRQTMAKNQTVTLDAGSANPVVIKCVDLNGAGVYSPSGSDENAKSMVMLVSYGAFDEVIGGDLTGDGSTDVETTVGPEVGDVEVYKVHHHGSRYSTNDNWLAATTPEVGIIMCGNGNSYGHPTAEALTRLHNHGVRTYWTETGAGATPNPSWDKVANGTVLVQADPGASQGYTVSGNGFNDAYSNGGGGGGNPPVEETLVANAITLLKGSITTGDVTRLAANDAVRVSIGAGVENGKYVTDWYGSRTLNGTPTELTITYDGNYTISRTQYLYLWNWQTSAWVQIFSDGVSTTDETKTWSTTSPAAYVSGSNEVRLRVRASTRSQGSYTCRGDYMAFTYTYQPASPQLVPGTPGPGPAIEPVAVVASHEEPLEHRLPQSTVRRLAARAAERGVTLTWSTDLTAHTDGFNIYREDAAGARVFVGGEAVVGPVGEEVFFTFTDIEAPAEGAIYWLGARACAGPEGLIGPFRATPGAGGADLSFAAGPVPARGAVTLWFTTASPVEARLEVFDVTGRRVDVPFAGVAPAGETRIAWNAARHPQGVYFARLEAGGRTVMSRIVIAD